MRRIPNNELQTDRYYLMYWYDTPRGLNNTNVLCTLMINGVLNTDRYVYDVEILSSYSGFNKTGMLVTWTLEGNPDRNGVCYELTDLEIRDYVLMETI